MEEEINPHPLSVKFSWNLSGSLKDMKSVRQTDKHTLSKHYQGISSFNRAIPSGELKKRKKECSWNWFDIVSNMPEMLCHGLSDQ